MPNNSQIIKIILILWYTIIRVKSMEYVEAKLDGKPIKVVTKIDETNYELSSGKSL